MSRHVLFASSNVSNIYKLYKILNEGFLKNFKRQVEFRISTVSSSKEFSLDVLNAAEDQRKWLETKALTIVERNFEKVVDET